MPRSGIRILAFLCLVLIAAAGLYAWQQSRYPYSHIVLAPHRALYRLETASIRNTTSIANVRGNMFYEWHESCEDWATDQKFHMEFLYPEGEPMVLNSAYSTIESRNGRSFNFSTQRERNQTPAEEIRGEAFFPIGGKGTIRFIKPDESKIALKRGALFPTHHTLALIEAARKGEVFFRAPLFDGSEVAPPVDVSAVMGKAENWQPQEDSLKENSLLKSPVHRVRMAFFANKLESGKKGTQNKTEMPDYEMTLMIHENGVVSEYQIDYPEFSLTAKLEALDALPRECP